MSPNRQAGKTCPTPFLDCSRLSAHADTLRAGTPRSPRQCHREQVGVLDSMMRVLPILLTGATAASLAGAAAFEEPFDSDPLTRGWRVSGDGALFHWNATNRNLEATWDSSRPNSYFHRPLGAVLTRHDDFGLAFELRLNDVAVGVNSNKPATFEIAIGFLRLADATSANFLRGVGIDPSNGPRNLVEFDYFPDSGFGATISPTIVSSNNQFATGFNFPLELAPGDLFRVTMNYSASNQIVLTTMTRNGQTFGPIKDVKLPDAFTDFRLDAVAVSSYSDAGADGSILARGIVDNLAVTFPEPPVRSLAGSFSNGLWRVEFVGQPGWFYTLERTENLQTWMNASPATAGLNGTVVLSDTTVPAGNAFYRVRAERP